MEVSVISEDGDPDTKKKKSTPEQDLKNINKQLNDKIKVKADKIANMSAKFERMENEVSNLNTNKNTEGRDKNRRFEKRPMTCYICFEEGHPFFKCSKASKKQIEDTRQQLADKCFDWTKYNAEMNRRKADLNATVTAPKA